MVAILDADVMGFLRSETSLIQTIGRAARNENGKVIMYADTISQSMKSAIDETKRRRKIQEKYNKEHKIIPKSVKKEVRSVLATAIEKKKVLTYKESMKKQELEDKLKDLNFAMQVAVDEMRYEDAIIYRDAIREIEKTLKGTK